MCCRRGKLFSRGGALGKKRGKELTFIELLLCRRRFTQIRSFHVVAEKQSSGVTGAWGCILALSLADCVWPPASDLKHLSFSFLSCKMGENNVDFPVFRGLNEMNAESPGRLVSTHKC